MATTADLRKAAAKVFTPFMISHGFTHADGCCYYKVVGDGVVQSVIVVPIKGTHGRVWVTCTVPELFGYNFQSGEKIQERHISIDSGGMLGEEGVEAGPSLFPAIGYAEQREAFLEALPVWIEKWAFPFFAEVNSRQKLWADMELRGKSEYYRKAVIGV